MCFKGFSLKKPEILSFKIISVLGKLEIALNKFLNLNIIVKYEVKYSFDFKILFLL